MHLSILNRDSVSLAVCGSHISQGLKETLKTNILLRFLFITKNKKRLQNFGEIANQQLQLYKNTFIIFSECHRGRTADPEDFHTAKYDPRVSLLECFFLFLFLSIYLSGISTTMLGLSFTKLPTAPGASGSHQKLQATWLIGPHLLLLLLFSSWEN